MTQADVVVVEGVGGFRVPLTDTHDTADLAFALKLPVVLVVGMRLGCISHALLTAEAIAARGLTLAGWVANRVDPDMLFPDENIESIRAAARTRVRRAAARHRAASRARPTPELAATISTSTVLLQTLRATTQRLNDSRFIQRIDHMTQLNIAPTPPTQPQHAMPTPQQRGRSARWRVADIVALVRTAVQRPAVRAQTVHREHFDPNTVQLSTLLSIKTGGCEEDCAYCPQARFLSALSVTPPRRRAARWQRARRGPVDLPHTLRQELRRWGEPVRMRHRRRGSKARRVVLLIDVSDP